jgi:hypothetical protein
MSHNHFVKVCSCGTIIINCGCIAKDKTEIVIKNGCTTCLKATESAARNVVERDHTTQCVSRKQAKGDNMTFLEYWDTQIDEEEKFATPPAVMNRLFDAAQKAWAEAKKPEAVKSRPTTLLDCKCGFKAGMVGYSGGNDGVWIIRCTRSCCPAMSQRVDKEETITAWNTMQEAI